MALAPTDPPIRDAATVVLVRDAETAPKVLMGQRGKTAAFMPNKMVFPGGRVDPGDADVRLVAPLAPGCAARLAAGPTPETLAVTAIRELWEETGAILGALGAWPTPPPDWRTFAATGHRPSASALSFVFRAVTPPGRPRRFDARFFVADAAALANDPDGLPAETEELSDIQWVPVDQAETFDLPFITRLVLAEVAQRLPDLGPPARVPFVQNDAMGSGVIWL